MTAHPQTLHVIGEGEDEIKLSSTNYYKLKDEMMFNKWDKFKKSKKFDEDRSLLNQKMMRIQNEWSEKNLQILRSDFISREKLKSNKKFSFWKDLISDINVTAQDFEIKPIEVSNMVSQFILGHFEQERSRLPLVEDKITFFRATQYPKIENLNVENLLSVRDAYKSFLVQIPEIYLLAIKNNIIHKNLKRVSPMSIPLLLEFNIEKVKEDNLIDIIEEENNLLLEANLH